MITSAWKLYVIVATIAFSFCLLLLCGNAIQFRATMSIDVMLSIITANIALFIAFFANIPTLLYVFTPVKCIKQKIEDILEWHNAAIWITWLVICIISCIISMICDFNHFVDTGDNLIWTLFSNNSHFARHF